MSILALDHVRLAVPPYREAEARAFYDELLGLPERGKPALPTAAAAGSSVAP